MKKNGFFAIIGLITVLAAVGAAIYYFVCKKQFCFGCCENDDCECCDCCDDDCCSDECCEDDCCCCEAADEDAAEAADEAAEAPEAEEVID